MPGHPTQELSPAEIDAIVSLLQDGDERTDSMIAAQLLQRPPASRQAVLERAEAAGVWVAMRLARVLRLNRREALAARFAALERDADGEVDLEEAALLIAEIGMPSVDADAVSRRLDAWAQDVDLAIAPQGGPTAELEALLTVLFQRLKLHGEQDDDYYAPQNSFLPHVMKTRTGLPITLSVLVLLVAERLDLPICGIGAPGHFLLRYDMPDESVYIDAFDGGTLLTAQDCLNLLRSMGHKAGRDALPVVGPTAIVLRMLNNLANAYSKLDDAESVADCRACAEGLAATTPAADSAS